MTKPKRHHIVPQCYLQSFTNEKDRLHVLPKDKRKPFQANTNNIAVRKHYYSFEDSNGETDVTIEKTLAKIEAMTKPIFDLIEGRNQLTAQQKEDFSVFLGLLYSRNPNFRDGVEETQREMIEIYKNWSIDNHEDMVEHIENTPEGIVQLAGGKDRVRGWLKKNMKVVMSPESSLRYVDLGIEISKFLVEMHWRFWINPYAKNPFLTSDNPCYVTNKAVERTAYGVGIGLKGSSFHFPVSPNIFLIADRRGDFIEYIDIRKRNKITRMNSRTIRHAESEVYGPILNDKIQQLHQKNKDYKFTTLIDHVGPYHVTRKKLVKI